MTIRTIPVAAIDASNRLRILDPVWVDLFAEEIAGDGLLEPIHVVERGDGFRLIDGARRLAAVIRLGRAEIEAIVRPANALASDADVRLAEIKAEMLHSDLTVLERARYLAEWRDIYLSAHAISKGGRRRANVTEDEQEELSAKFALSFSTAARRALKISRRSLFLALKIASIDAQVAAKIALHPIADVQRELLLLAEQRPPMQASIATLLINEPERVQTVTEALMQFGGVPASLPEPVYVRFSERFSRLQQKDQFAFFALHESAIDLWLAKRASGARKAA